MSGFAFWTKACLITLGNLTPFMAITQFWSLLPPTLHPGVDWDRRALLRLLSDLWVRVIFFNIYKQKFLFLLGKYQGKKLLGHTVSTCLTSQETVQLFSK